MRELSLNVLDIAQNSIAAGASVITMTVEEDAGADRLTPVSYTHLGLRADLHR